MNLEDFIDEQFVNDYDIIKNFMIEINDILENIGIDDKYDNYNDFCIDIKKHLFTLINLDDIDIDVDTLINALNNMIKYKIMNDIDYENKIKMYFDDPYNILDKINSIKLKK